MSAHPNGTRKQRARGKSKIRFECGHRGHGARCHRCAHGNALLGVKIGDAVTIGHELVMGAGGGDGHPVMLWGYIKIITAKKRECAKTELEKRSIVEVHCTETVERCHAEGERLIRTNKKPKSKLKRDVWKAFREAEGISAHNFMSDANIKPDNNV